MPKRLKIEAIVPAAGLGRRLKGDIAKPLVSISGSPIIIRTLKVLNAHPQVSKIIVLSHKKDLRAIQKLISKNKIHKVKNIVEGGVRRRDSVAIGLKFISRDTDFVLIHDAARPFVNKKIISKVISSAVVFGASVAGVRLKPTIKKIKLNNGFGCRLPNHRPLAYGFGCRLPNHRPLAYGFGCRLPNHRPLAYGCGYRKPNHRFPACKKNHAFVIEKTLDRENIWEIQTPQVFKKDLILKAHKRFKKIAATDDACLVEKLGESVSVVEGSYFNIKVTTPEDLVFAKAIVNYQKFKRGKRCIA